MYCVRSYSTAVFLVNLFLLCIIWPVDGAAKSKYIDLDFLLSTSVLVESLFGDAKFVFSDHRRMHIDYITLKKNLRFWDVQLLDPAMNDELMDRRFWISITT